MFNQNFYPSFSNGRNNGRAIFVCWWFHITTQISMYFYYVLTYSIAQPQWGIAIFDRISEYDIAASFASSSSHYKHSLKRNTGPNFKNSIKLHRSPTGKRSLLCWDLQLQRNKPENPLWQWEQQQQQQWRRKRDFHRFWIVVCLVVSMELLVSPPWHEDNVVSLRCKVVMCSYVENDRRIGTTALPCVLLDSCSTLIEVDVADRRLPLVWRKKNLVRDDPPSNK